MSDLEVELKAIDKAINAAAISLQTAEDKWDVAAEACDYSSEDPDSGLLCGNKKNEDFFCFHDSCPLIK
jgi:hypothetical protein